MFAQWDSRSLAGAGFMAFGVQAEVSLVARRRIGPIPGRAVSQGDKGEGSLAWAVAGCHEESRKKQAHGDVVR